MLAINDIDQLRWLETVSARLNVHFALHGGVAFRLALRQMELEGVYDELIDLFDLAPFTADVDLLYAEAKNERGTGDLSEAEERAQERKRTGEVLKHVLEVVPNADCFRWRLIPLTQVTATMGLAADLKATEHESNPWPPKMADHAFGFLRRSPTGPEVGKNGKE